MPSPAVNFIVFHIAHAKTNQQPQKTSEQTFVRLDGVKGRQTTRITTADTHSFISLLQVYSTI